MMIPESKTVAMRTSMSVRPLCCFLLLRLLTGAPIPHAVAWGCLEQYSGFVFYSAFRACLTSVRAGGAFYAGEPHDVVCRIVYVAVVFAVRADDVVPVIRVVNQGERVVVGWVAAAFMQVVNPLYL